MEFNKYCGKNIYSKNKNLIKTSRKNVFVGQPIILKQKYNQSLYQSVTQYWTEVFSEVGAIKGRFILKPLQINSSYSMRHEI